MTTTDDQTSDLLQYVGEGLGVTGAALVALPSPLARAAGFAVWLVGNSAWIAYGRRAGNRHIARLFLSVEAIEDLLDYEPNERECEIYRITSDEYTRALEEALRVKKLKMEN